MHYGRNFTVTYRAALRELRLQTAGWLGITRRFDERGRTIRQTVTGLAEVNNVFDPSGWLTETRIGSGAAQRVHTFLRDLRGNLESVEDPEGHTAQFEFDHLDRLLRVVRADGGETVFLYTAAGRLDTYFPPALPEMAPSVRMLRNEAGDLAAVQRSDGRTLYLSRDPVSAAAIHSMELERGTILLSHDTVTGRVDSISDPDGGIMYFTWDGSLLTSVAWVGEVSGTVTSTYADGTFRLLQEEVAGSPPVAYVYNSDDGLRDVGTMKVYRDSQHNLPKRAVLGKVETQWTHNPFAELQTLEADDGTDSFYSSTWTRNRRGQMTAWAETFPAQSRLRQYTYDSVGRLVSMTEGEVFTEAYSYDQNGNRLSRTLGAATEDATFDSHDRMRTQGDVSYEYAPDGELIRRIRGTDVTSYEYDEMGNLLAVDLPDGRRITYVVDGANHRIGRRVDGVLQEGWLYRGQFQIAASVDASGSVVARYVWGDRGNVPEYMLKGDISYRFVTDHLGSIRMVVRTDTGEVAQWMDYDSYGNVIQDTSPGFQPFGFAGGLLDPDTGLVLFGLRNYSPEMGRWTTKDPMLFLGGSTNLYEYAKGDPLNQVDPTGMNPCKPLTDRWDDADGGGFQVPYWLDGIMGLGGAIWSGLSGPLATIGSGLLGPLTWLVAFEGARQSGETIADRVVTQPDQQLQQTLDDLALESSGSSSRGVGPQD